MKRWENNEESKKRKQHFLLKNSCLKQNLQATFQLIISYYLCFAVGLLITMLLDNSIDSTKKVSNRNIKRQNKKQPSQFKESLFDFVIGINTNADVTEKRK